jgi:hypothetical protein
MSKNIQSRKWHLIINNPTDYSHKRIFEIIRENFCSIIYFCMAQEQGKTLHTHLYMLFSGGVRFQTIKKHFPTAHIEAAQGSSLENRTYIAKEGKWENNEKCDTKIEGTFEEWGVMPVERQGGVGVEAIIIERIQEGATNAEILLEFPHYLRGIRDVEYVRQSLKAEENRDKWRDLETIYIFGGTGLGKTRYVMDGFGYSNVYAVNNYKHPFDGYTGESVMLFDEFCSGIRIQDMNNYLDGYPLALPARYSNKQACYERVFIISNLDLLQQYKHEQLHQPEIWAAFLRRIHKVIHFMRDGSRREYNTEDYVSGMGSWTELPKDTASPFE